MAERDPHDAPQGRVPRTRLTTWVLAASMMTLILFGLSAYYVEETMRVGHNLTAAYLEGEALRDLIDKRRQELSLSAMMLVTTRDIQWMEQHHQTEQDLLDAVLAALEQPRPGYDVDALLEIREAVRGLSRVETDAFQLAGGGDVEAALELLSGGGYQIWSDQYSRSSQRFIDSFLAYLQSQLEAHQRDELRSLGVAMSLILICIFIWLYLAVRVRKWSDAFRAELATCNRLERELMQAQKMEAVGRLASGIAHDFSNLLTAIRGYATLARERLCTDSPARLALSRVEEAADHAEGVTRQLLLFSRDGVAEKKPVDLVRMINEACSWLRRLLPGTIRLKTDLPSDDQICVFADRSQLQQMLMNLVVNARDAMPDGGEISISIGPPDKGPVEHQRVTVRVSDTGQGMHPSVVQRAIEPFFTTKRPEEGTGLGLSVVHGIVVDHGGDMRIESQPGAGTEISLTFPVTDARETESGMPADETPATGSGTVLLAQGDLYVREILTAALQDSGFDVSPTITCQDFRSMYEKGLSRPDLVILDADLPGGCGPDCLKRLRDHGYHGPAILLTHQLSKDLERRLEGDAMVLHKPVRIGELRRLAVAMVDSRSDRGVAA